MKVNCRHVLKVISLPLALYLLFPFADPHQWLDFSLERIWMCWLPSSWDHRIYFLGAVGSKTLSQIWRLADDHDVSSLLAQDLFRPLSSCFPGRKGLNLLGMLNLADLEARVARLESRNYVSMRGTKDGGGRFR